MANVLDPGNQELQMHRPESDWNFITRIADRHLKQNQIAVQPYC